ncbi:uncharacterized protein LOC105924580 isoform X2 [Fundulus heteroclitus]|uniref:uncharacterized protein LOC105924580 isoform X2 n=1 Tax=Fundulus heteroclitus TaxID=8078 RepID=UPI00165C3322|nr:uncharacterized protein LOC105924580 isoform X2 [Fundulus heteroclitus]
MEEGALRSGNVSLTLMNPTEEDSGEYRCRVKKSGELLRAKNIHLTVKVHQVEVEQGVESVLLPFTTSPGLPEEARVVWMDKEDRKVHVYKKGENGSDHPKEQDQLYRNRTRMKEDLLRTGDLSLTLMRLTNEDSGVYFCRVLTDSRLMRRKTVYVTVKGRVQDQNQPLEPAPLTRLL